MAKVRGPLHSHDASGTFAGQTTHRTSKGRHIASAKADTPTRYTIGQEDARNAVRALTPVAHWVKRSDMIGPGRTISDLRTLLAKSGDGNSWKSVLFSYGIAGGLATWTRINQQWDAAGGGTQAAWTAAAAALDPPMRSSLRRTSAPSGFTQYPPGFTFWVLTETFYQMGAGPSPQAGIPTYTNP